MEMNDMDRCAAVILTTLNRYEHFRRCMESLDCNAWAQYTEVYVSVDYPPAEKYVEGYQKIVDYLKDKKFNFKKVNIYMQEENLGALKNKDFVRNIAFDKYERLIMMEDDFEVSANFLEYMNKAFIYSEEHPEIFGVCAYQIPVEKCRGTVYKSQHISWGFGVSRQNWEKMQSGVSEQWLNNYMWDLREMYKLFRNSKRTFYYFYNNYLIGRSPMYFREEGRIRTIDIVKEIYLRQTGQYILLPTVTKVKNTGFDGSGVNCGKSESRAKEIQELDTDYRFELQMEKNKSSVVKMSGKMSWAGVRHIKKDIYLSFLLYLCYWIKRQFQSKH